MAKTEKETLEALAKKHGVKKIYTIEVLDEEGNVEDELLLKPLNRRAFGILTSVMQTDPCGAIEGVLAECCVSDNKSEYMGDDMALMSLASPIAEMMNTKSASLKKN
jgi:hypothetical protein